MHKDRYTLWLGGMIIFAFMLGGLPYATAFWVEDDQHLFSGYLHFPEDMDSYAAFSEESANGQWLFYNPYDASGSGAAYFNSLWLLTGKIKGLIGLPFARVLILLRLAACVAMFFAFVHFCRRMGFSRETRLFALAWFAFGGGFGWLQNLIHLPAPPPDLYTELFPFAQLMLVPHAGLAHALLILAFILLLDGETEEDPLRSLLAGLCLLLLGSFRTYDMLVGLCVFAAFMFLSFVLKPNRGKAIRMIGAILPALPVIPYTWWLTSRSDGFSIWGETNRYDPPDLPTLALGLGLPLLMGLLFSGLSLKQYKRLSLHRQFLLVWIAVAWSLMLSGLLPFAWRTCASFTTPLVIGGACTIGYLFSASSRKARPVAWMLLITLSLPSSLILFQEKMQQAFEQYRYYFQSPAIIEAIEGLDRLPGECLVITHGHIGLKIPAYSHCRSLLGHKDLTRNLKAKKRDYHLFLSAKRTSRAKEILDRYGIDTIFWGPLDRRSSNLAPEHLPGYGIVATTGLTTVYRKLE